MRKLIVVVLAVAFAGAASAADWRDLRVDGSSEEAFARSMTEFKDELSPRRAHVFGEALKDIWIQGATAAEAEQREYTADEYYSVLDGLSYEDVVSYTDPTGDTAKTRYRKAKLSMSCRLDGRREPPVARICVSFMYSSVFDTGPPPWEGR